MQFPAVLRMGVSALASSSQLVPCSDSTSNNYCNDIPNIKNITSNENTGLVDGSMNVDAAMSPGRLE